LSKEQYCKKLSQKPKHFEEWGAMDGALKQKIILNFIWLLQ
jgi:hypothetical protein